MLGRLISNILDKSQHEEPACPVQYIAFSYKAYFMIESLLEIKIWAFQSPNVRGHCLHVPCTKKHANAKYIPI